MTDASQVTIENRAASELSSDPAVPVANPGFDVTPAALVTGIIGMTSEYRHFTTRPTFLFEARRHRVIVAKLVAYSALGSALSACHMGQGRRAELVACIRGHRKVYSHGIQGEGVRIVASRV